jgi:glutathione S-transferase
VETGRIASFTAHVSTQCFADPVANFQGALRLASYRAAYLIAQPERMVKLYSLPLSPFAARVRAAIYAKNLPVEIVAPPSDWRTSPDYRKLNPLVRIPVLVLDDGSTLPESGLIVEYLEDSHPEPSLRPRSAKDLARVRLITQVAEHYVLQAISPLFQLFDTKNRDEAVIAAQLAKLDGALKQLDDLLQPGTYAFGGQLTTADVWLAPLRYVIDGLMGWSGRSGLLDRHHAVAAYADVARSDPYLGRVWREMEEGLKVFMASRAAAG